MKKTQYLIIKYVEGSLDLCHTRIKSGRMIKEFRRYLQKKFPNYTFVEIKVEKGRLRVESRPILERGNSFLRVHYLNVFSLLVISLNLSTWSILSF